MAIFLSTAAFLLSISAVVVGAEALRRINGQNEEFLKIYVKQIRVDLDAKDAQLVSLKKEIQEMGRGRVASRETLRQLEKNKKSNRDTEAVERYGDFIPSSAPARKRNIA
jgi:hypothetical protein